MNKNDKIMFDLIKLRHELDAIIITIDSEKDSKAYKDCIDASINLYSAIINLKNRG